PTAVAHPQRKIGHHSDRMTLARHVNQRGMIIEIVLDLNTRLIVDAAPRAPVDDFWMLAVRDSERLARTQTHKRPARFTTYSLPLRIGTPRIPLTQLPLGMLINSRRRLRRHRMLARTIHRLRAAATSTDRTHRKDQQHAASHNASDESS